MLVPFLISAGIGFGVWWMLRKDESVPSIPTPDETNLVSASAGDSPQGKYSVLTIITSDTQDSYHNMADFNTWRSAWEYYKQVVAFLDENHGSWTCPTGSGLATVAVFDDTASQRAVKTYATCPHSQDATRVASLRDAAADVRKFFEELAGTSDVISVSRYALVRLVSVTPDGADVLGTWTFNSTVAAAEYYQDLQDALRRQDVVEAYRPDHGKLILMVAWPDWNVGWTGGRIAVWDGTEVASDSGVVTPTERGNLVVDFL